MYKQSEHVANSGDNILKWVIPKNREARAESERSQTSITGLVVRLSVVWLFKRFYIRKKWR